MTSQNTNSNTRHVLFGYASGVFAAIVVTNAFDYSRQTELGGALVMLVFMTAILINSYSG